MKGANALTVLMGACLIGATVVGCGAGVPAAGQAGGDSASAEAVLERASEAMQEVETYRFAVQIAREQPEHNRTGEPAPERSGEWSAPNDWVLRLEGEARIASVDGLLYFKDPDEPDGPWQGGLPANEYPGFVPYPPLLDLTDAELLGEATVAGTEVYRVRGQAQRDNPALRFGEELDIEVLVRKEDYLPVQMTILNAYQSVAASEPGGTPEPLPTRPEDALTMTYSEFNVPIEIDVP